MKGEVETIEGGCQICGGDVKGNDKYKFFCEHCNILYERRYLRQGQEDRPSEPPEARKEPFRLPDGVKCIASNHSDKYHKLGCRYVDQIKGSHLKHFKSSIEAERNGYKACTCAKK
jgi:hypothetical protein